MIKLKLFNMKRRFFSVMNNEIVVFDAQTTRGELIKEFFINFFYAFCANISTPFIVLRTDIPVLISFIGYYYLLSYFINRERYNTNFGRYVMMPLPCILGAFLSYKLGFFIVEFIKSRL